MLPSPVEPIEGLRVQQTGEYAKEIWLDRPRRANALDPALVDNLIEVITGAYGDDTRLVIIRGSGRHFCSGFDRSAEVSLEGQQTIRRLLNIETLLQLLWRAPFASVACVHGKAVGAGADLAAACDYRLVSRAASFAFPGFRLAGVALGNRRLAELIGSHLAFDIILRGAEIDSAQALECGLATEALEPEGFGAFISDLQRQLHDVAKPSISILREATRAPADAFSDIERIVRSVAVAAQRQ